MDLVEKLKAYCEREILTARSDLVLWEGVYLQTLDDADLQKYKYARHDYETRFRVCNNILDIIKYCV